MIRGALSQRRELLEGQPELGAVPVGGLEVVPDDLVDLREPLARPPLELPSDQLVVEGPHTFRRPRLGDVADQDVAERVGSTARRHLLEGDQVAGHQLVEGAGERP